MNREQDLKNSKTQMELDLKNREQELKNLKFKRVGNGDLNRKFRKIGK